MQPATWYLRRLGAMSPTEVAWRVEDRLRQERWARRRFGAPALCPEPPDRLAVPDVDPRAVPDATRRSILDTAERLLDGKWEVLGVVRDDLVDPDWMLDPRSSRAFPSACAFRIAYREAADGPDVKQVWELSRHHHLTVLSCAWWLTRDERFATRAAEHLRSWWQANPVLTGVNWNSGIELGIRLISWVWTRRLLDGWSGAAALFEDNPVARHQVYWHQRWLADFESRGSSANNHVVAEAAGQLVASSAFAWFEESEGWRARAATLLEAELARNTFPSGLDREQAFDYHGLVAELGLVAAAEAEAAGTPLGAGTWRLLCRMLDALAAVCDATGRPPRYGDGDDGRALVVDDPAASRSASLLGVGAALFGPLPWWPPTSPDPQSLWLAALAARPIVGGTRPAEQPLHGADVPRPPAAGDEPPAKRPAHRADPGDRPASDERPGAQPSHSADAGGTILRTPADAGEHPGDRPAGGERPQERPSHFADAGLTILRTPASDDNDEIWCRLDSGPHGFGSIAAHAHADALALELRVDGVDVLADPGTYCYHAEPAFRRYFRSTLGHNTLELDGLDQSVAGGPFLWTRMAGTQILDLDLAGADPEGADPEGAGNGDRHDAGNRPGGRDGDDRENGGNSAGKGALHWSARHDGYRRLAEPATHRRTVTLEPATRTLDIVDEIETAGRHRARLAFHLGPSVEATLDGSRAELRWAGPDATPREAVLDLPDALSWQTYRGSTDPVLGWYSPGFGRRQPATTLVGTATLPACELRTRLTVAPRPAGTPHPAGAAGPDPTPTPGSER